MTVIPGGLFQYNPGYRMSGVIWPDRSALNRFCIDTDGLIIMICGYKNGIMKNKLKRMSGGTQ